jgi:hypothetical protein
MDILQHIPNLTPFSFFLACWPALDHQAMANFPMFPSIERLCLKYVDFSDSHHLDGLLVRFPNVHELYMEHSSMPENAAYTGDYRASSLRLRSLEFVDCIMDPLLRYFLRGLIVPTSHVSMISLLFDDIPIVGEYFAMFGNVLRDVRVGLFDDRDGTENLGKRNLTLLCIFTQFL